MAYNLKEVAKKPERLTGGHRMCAGCGAPVVVRQILKALKPEDHAVISSATGCLEVSTFIYPYTAWTDSFIHSAFENTGATISGAEAAYNVMKRKGKFEGEAKFIAFGGDGGTYDIGFQALSGAMERGHDMVYVCYDNGAYMNTGIQRSSATPKYADTTTSPAGKKIPGKMQPRKDLTEIMANHHIPYVAQTAPIGNMKDLYEKAEKAIYTPGPAFLNVLAPCPRGWRYNTPDLMELSKMAVETCFWPLYEVIDGKYIINYKPKTKLPVKDFLKLQGRFKHLFKAGNEYMLEEIQKEVDSRWETLLKLAGEA
ncbi:thiamine pyrophosphate-dependent enzyme [Acetivibrio mesophilus]|uniref:Pyruvate ferredoxin oxidoreductase n=1 Tax=Acetivibrio mesophilus TaxID=2487273 RepID=A0A4Q0I3H4_9FIRM|nr:thiamine pyrophosphate-dependent enzyme [Acetivibrio mesophilus]ODM27181.1 pyruvate ferredoxin oxidoreductase [Clostridium sp. Bc-iso-3]RXE58786.1 pyruvate ferredoxin oxidoreductase [Acetivibrio mesophilus]